MGDINGLPPDRRRAADREHAERLVAAYRARPSEVFIPLSLARRELALLKAELRGERRATVRLLKSLGIHKSWTEAGHHRDHGRFARADPLPESPAAPEPGPDYAALYEALLAAVIEARESGDDDAVPGLVDAYRERLSGTGEIHKGLPRDPDVVSLAAEMALEMGAAL